MSELKDIMERLTRIEAIMSGLYLPGPAEAEEQRPKKPFDNIRKSGKKRVAYDQNALPEFRGGMVFHSKAMKTRGFTHHNAFAKIELALDTVPEDLGDHLLFTAVLEGACGSTWVELDSAQLFSTGRTGEFQVPLLGADSLALDTRFVLYAGDNATYPEPPPASPRLIRFQITGMLISGYEM